MQDGGAVPRGSGAGAHRRSRDGRARDDAEHKGGREGGREAGWGTSRRTTADGGGRGLAAAAVGGRARGGESGRRDRARGSWACEPRAYIWVMCPFRHSTLAYGEASLLHAHGSSRYWEHWVHPAPPALSKRSTHALHPAAERSDEVLQPLYP